jgi:ATP dependent DNA ligase-like protein/citrate transporter
MARPLGGRRRTEATALPGWIKPQLTKLVDQPPDGPEWLHELKFDGYRMHARLDRSAVRLLTRTGLDWTPKYPTIAAGVASLAAKQAYLDGELCSVRPDGTTSFSLIQNASDTGNSGALVFFLFDLLHLDGEAIAPMPLTERKAAAIFAASYLALAVGRVPGLAIDRAGVALVGACLMVAGGALPIVDAYKAVDLDTLTLLLGMMIVVANLRLSGFFTQASGWVMRRAHYPNALLAAVTAVARDRRRCDTGGTRPQLRNRQR